MKPMLTIDDMIDRFDGSIGYATNSEEICQYIADLLKELKERRKAPEIIHCGECRFNDGTAYCEVLFMNVKGKDYCSWAERRTDADD